jgi:hypothetical protein
VLRSEPLKQYLTNQCNRERLMANVKACDYVAVDSTPASTALASCLGKLVRTFAVWDVVFVPQDNLPVAYEKIQELGELLERAGETAEARPLRLPLAASFAALLHRCCCQNRAARKFPLKRLPSEKSFNGGVPSVVQVDKARQVLKELVMVEANLRAHEAALSHLRDSYNPTMDRSDFAHQLAAGTAERENASRCWPHWFSLFAAAQRVLGNIAGCKHANEVAGLTSCWSDGGVNVAEEMQGAFSCAAPVVARAFFCVAAVVIVIEV